MFILTSGEVTMDTIEKIKQQIAENPVILYMKGSPEQPQCGFSARAAQTLQACGVSFAHVDVLANPDIRQTLPLVANWPTFPQLYVQGELIGGSDIIAELYASGELQTILSTEGVKS
jgi:monothiol glutaredoxin